MAFFPKEPKKPFEATSMYKDYQRATTLPTTKKGRKRQYEARTRLQGAPESSKRRLRKEMAKENPYMLLDPFKLDPSLSATPEAPQPYTLLPGLEEPTVRRRSLIGVRSPSRRR